MILILNQMIFSGFSVVINESSLFEACRSNNADVLNKLINSRVNLNARNQVSRTFIILLGSRTSNIFCVVCEQHIFLSVLTYSRFLAAVAANLSISALEGLSAANGESMKHRLLQHIACYDRYEV